MEGVSGRVGRGCGTQSQATWPGASEWLIHRVCGRVSPLLMQGVCCAIKACPSVGTLLSSEMLRNRSLFSLVVSPWNVTRLKFLVHCVASSPL